MRLLSVIGLPFAYWLLRDLSVIQSRCNKYQKERRRPDKGRYELELATLVSEADGSGRTLSVLRCRQIGDAAAVFASAALAMRIEKCYQRRLCRNR